MRAITRDEVAEVFASRLSALKGSGVMRTGWPKYTMCPAQNLVPGVSEQDFADDLRGGDGGELTEVPERPAKFCAAHSSSALAVNTFAPLRREPNRIGFEGLSALTGARFERQCENGLIGTNPNLDFLAEGPSGALAVESKCLELLDPKRAVFSRQYESAMATWAEPAWAHLYESLLREPDRFDCLDAAQLVKHYLGLRRTFGAEGRLVVLLYVYWEPRNAAEFSIYAQHREEVSCLRHELSGSSIRFAARSYPQLWTEGEGRCLPTAHVQALRERYELEL
jgi:hypothetical protein